MEKLNEIYNELLDMGVVLKSGVYNLQGDCDSVVVSDGKHYGIFLDIKKIRTVAQEKESVSHEWAHIATGTLYALDAPEDVRRKSEVRANRAQIKRILPYEEMRSVMRSGVQTKYALADYFTVSEELIEQAFEYYTGPCGLTF